MKTLYVAYSTEYEKGWGSRPDGLAITEEKAVIDKLVLDEYEKGSYECYWRYSEPQKIVCDETTWDKIKESFKDGVYYSSSNSLKEIGTFFKEI